MLTIGITGGSGSGKSTLVKNVLGYFNSGQAEVIQMDAYYKDSSHWHPEERTKINFDHPDAFEFDLLHRHLMDLEDGKAIERPVYDFITSTRKPETILIKPMSVVIVEGILLFSDKRVRELFDIKIFLDAEPDDRIIRIMERDIKERGRTMADVLNRYELVKTSHSQFVESTKRYADIIIPHGGENRVAIEMLTALVNTELQKQSAATV